MANPVTHLEKTIAGEVQPVTHLEHVIAEYGGGGGGGGFTPTDAQLDAMNSGITEEDVEQIDTNKTNILTLEKMNGAKNMLQYTLNDLKKLNPTLTWNNNVATISGGGCTFTVNDDMSIDVVATDSHTQANLTLPYYPLNKGNTVLMGCPSGGSPSTYKLGFIGFGYDTGNGIDVPNQTSNNRVFIEISANKPLTGTYKPMIISKDVYDAGFTDYQRYAMSNAELTTAIRALQAQLANQ
jgi:hypothetical protein